MQKISIQHTSTLCIGTEYSDNYNHLNNIKAEELFEVGQTALLAACGTSWRDIDQRFEVFCVVFEKHAVYRTQVLPGENVEIETHLEVGPVRFVFSQRMKRHDVVCIEYHITRVLWSTRRRRTIALPEELRLQFHSCVAE